MSRVFAAVTVLAAFAMVSLNLWGPGGYSSWAKMTASTAFICLALSVGALQWNYGRIMLAGLFLSWWGDWFLTGSGDTRFLLGLVSFLSAHVMYCIAFGLRGINWRWSAAALPAVAAVTAGALWWILPHVGAEMAWPVRAYTGVISVMVVLSFGAKGAGGPWAIPIGAVLFYFSDLSVASGQFVKPDFPNYVWGLPFYFIGQVFLAYSAKTISKAATPMAATRPKV